MNLDEAQVFDYGGGRTETVYYAAVHIGAWWHLNPDGTVTFSHDRESLLAWLNGDHRRFGPGVDCYDAEADGPVAVHFPSKFWTVVLDSSGFDEVFETSRRVHLA